MARSFLNNSASSKITRILTSARRSLGDNVRTRAVMASPPTVTQGTTLAGAGGTGLTKEYRVTTAPGVFRQTGAAYTPYLHATAYNRYPAVKPGATPGTNIGDGASNGTIWRVACMVDSIKFSVLHGGYAAKYRYSIDGQYIDASGYTPSSSTSSQACFDTLDFTTAGGRKERLLVIEGEANMSFGGVFVSPTETVRHPGGSPLSMLFIGTSLVVGVGATQAIDGFAAVAADFLGVDDFVASGVASSGWLTKPNGISTFRERIADMTTRAYDFILIDGGGFNDANTGQDPAAVQAEVFAFLPLLRAAHPQTPIAMLGIWPGKTGPSATWLAMENAVKAAVTAWNDPLTRFVPVATDPNGPWIAGTGYVGAPTGGGNSDVHVGGDQIHPPTGGHLYFGRRAASGTVAAFVTI